MFIQRRFLIAVVLVGLVGGLASRAPITHAAGSWSAWLYNSDTGELIHVFPDGAPATSQMLPLPSGTSTPPWSLTISREGAYLAACYVDDANNTTVRVYDLYQNNFLSSYNAGQVQGCVLSYYAFSEDSGQLAVGLLNHYPGMNDPRPVWQLVVLDTFSGNVLHELNPNSPAMTATGYDSSGQVPVVSTFQVATATYPGLISWRPVRWGTEGMCEYPSFVWNLTDNTVYPGGNAGKSQVDYLIPNSEAIWVETNDAYPKTTPMGPGCEHNMVMYSNKAGANYSLFTNGMLVSGTEFVDDGRRIAFRTDPGSGQGQWWTMDRAGVVTPLPADIQAYQVWGTLDGYVFLNQNQPDGGAPEVRYHRFTTGSTPDAFVAWTGSPGAYWQIIWVNDLTGGAGLPPFPPMAQAAPTQPPGPQQGLFIGGQATVNTTEGDMLRVRTGPGLGYAIAFQAANGERVTIIDGPVSSDGYTWWRLDVPGRGQGWAIEGLQEPGGWLQTLIPVP